MTSDKVKFIIWDSEGSIKNDPKTGINKTWGDFIQDFKKNDNHKIIDNGENFSEKEDGGCIKFIQDRFKRAKKNISSQNALVLSEIVGRDRGFLDSEISKLILTAPDEVDDQFIMENAYPSASHAVIYKFGNALDSGSYSKSIDVMQHFLDIGINENVMADIIAKKARWQLVSVSLWNKGMSWAEVIKVMMTMGKFPSKIWHDEVMTPTDKRKSTDGLKTIEDRIGYMTKEGGLPEWMMNKEDKAARAEVIPMEFMAKLTVDAINNNIVAPNVNLFSKDELKGLVLMRGINVYLFVLGKLKEIRYGINPKQDLQEMIAAMTNRTLNTTN
jgi:hypothetical protein